MHGSWVQIFALCQTLNSSFISSMIASAAGIASCFLKSHLLTEINNPCELKKVAFKLSTCTFSEWINLINKGFRFKIALSTDWIPGMVATITTSAFNSIYVALNNLLQLGFPANFSLYPSSY
jgi:hypothetical protein